MPLRLRLTLLFVLLLGTALAGFAVGVYVIAAKQIYEGVDEGLQNSAREVVNALGPLSAPLSQQDVTSHRHELDSEASIGTIFQVRDPSGNILYSSSEQLIASLPSPGKKHPNVERTLTRHVQGRRFRFLYQPLTGGGGMLGSLEVAQSLKETDEALSTIRYVLIFGGLTAMLVTSVSGYVLAGRALQPVRQVSRLARDIERTADFSRRLPATRSRGEMQELVATFNAMIGRVERTLVAQRDFLADSSHELRRPLTVLRTNIDVLKAPGLPPEEREACLREMGVEAGAMSRLLSDLLLLTRDEAQAIGYAPVDYSSLCQQAVARLRNLAGDRQVVAEVAPAVRVVGDRERLEQMLWNLLENAWHYTPRGGRIELHLAHVDGVARVEVSDTGAGIPQGELPHVFKRFYRGERARAMRSEGTGLGLAIVKYVAEAHRGTVHITSQVGQGSLVMVDLPASG